MVSPSVSAVALATPLVASNAIFSARRANRGVEYMEEQPLFGAMNMTIAGAQVLKGINASAKAMIAMDSNLEKPIQTASSKVSKLAKSNKIFKYTGKFFNFIANHINPIICLAGGIKVLGSEDKVDTAARESLSLTTMFIAEAGYKKLFGMPKDVKGALVKRESCYPKFMPFIDKQLNKLKNSTKISAAIQKYPVLNSLPGIVKGLGFALASIGGYMLGSKLADKIIGHSSSENKKEAQNNQ